MGSGATTCPCPSSVCRSVWGMAAVIAFAARSKKSVGRPANWGSVVGPSLGCHQDRLSDAGKSVRGDLVAIEDHGILDERVGERDG